MPEFICVQCFTCETFQVQQVKKTAKFTCRMCQAPQSVRKTYAVSTQAKDIRSVVVELNAKRCEAEQQFVPKPRANSRPGIVRPADQSQWSGFISETDVSVQEYSDLDAEPDGFVTSLPDAGQRKRRQLNQNSSDGDKRKMTVCTGRTAIGVSGMQSHHMVQSAPKSLGQSASHTLHSSPLQRSSYGPVLQITQAKAVKPVPGALSCSYSYRSSRGKAASADVSTKDDQSHHYKRADFAQKQHGSSTWSSFLLQQDPEQMHIGESAVDDDSERLLVTSFD
ncbi:hypothetical protein WJX77_006607 [Trebouxia sp. C0004]